MKKAKKFIPICRPNINDTDIQKVVDVLKSGMLVQGKHVKAVEDRIAKFIGCKYAIAVANGTASLHLALRALNISSGDEVVVPAFSYVATANVVELVGARPVFVDVDLDTCNIKVEGVESIKSRSIKAIMPVHEFGLAADIKKLSQIASERKWYMVEDAACALGAFENGQHVGTFKEFGSFSFHPRKAITSGEGGLVVTNDNTLAEKILVLRNHGIDPKNNHNFIEAGFNYRLTEMQAVLLDGQFSRFPEMLKTKRQLASLYYKNLKQIPEIRLPNFPLTKEHAWQSYHIILDDHINRDQVISELFDKGIGTNYGAQCIPAMTFYQKKYRFDIKTLFPKAWTLYKQGLVLPLYETLEEEQINYICNSLIKIIHKKERN